MKKYRAIATITTYAEAFITANSEKEAYDIADNMDGGDFAEVLYTGGWTIEIESAG